MNETLLWECETPVKDIESLDLDVPAWIEQDITPSTLMAISQGGCASGAYMPAVTYATANKVMGEHGDDVLDYLSNEGIELSLMLQNIDDTSWSGLACKVLSAAVETWTNSVIEEVSGGLEGEADDTDDDE